MSALRKLFDETYDPRGRRLLTCQPSPPPAPDYRGAAQAQGAANVEAARVAAKMNNPNVSGPFGSQMVTWVGDTPYVQQTLSPIEQMVYSKNAVNRAELGTLAGRGIGIASGVLGQAPNYGSLPAAGQSAAQSRTGIRNELRAGLEPMPVSGQAARTIALGDLQAGLAPMPKDAEALRGQIVNAMMARVNEDVNRKSMLDRSNLYAAGIPSSSQAFNDAMALNERVRTDAANQAYLAAGQEMSRNFAQDLARRQQGAAEFGQATQAGALANQLDLARRQQGVSEFGTAANLGIQASQLDASLRQQALAQLLAQRQTPLNEITALMSGQQINNPFAMPAYAQNAQVAPAPVFGATQALANYNTDLYNAQAAQAGNLQQGLFGLGGAGLLGYFASSDRRLKTQIRRIGTHPLGIGWYDYNIGGHHEQGVMADEVQAVRPDAVVTGPDGYLMVNYGMIGRDYVSAT